jgi:PAS domain S-box-containing protein
VFTRSANRASAGSFLSRIQYALPRGQTLPKASWERRHQGILKLLWLHVVGVPIFGIARGYGVGHCLIEATFIATPALLASFGRSRKARAGFVSLGLLTSSALLVHLSGGYIEAHFHFFVMIVVLTLYEDWFPFLLAVAYVVIHHGLGGALDPNSVFNHAAGRKHPWEWAGIHALFVAGAGLASVVAWRLNEDVRHRLTAVVDSSHDAIFSTDFEAAIESWNPGAERIYGYTAEEMIGKKVSVTVPEDRRDEIGWILSQVRSGKTVESFETVRLKKTGEPFDVSLTISPTRDTTNKIVGYTAVGRDITEQKRADQRLQEAREEADRLKQEFFELVSHDLRTPLTSIKGYSDMLLDGQAGDLSGEAQDFIGVITRNAVRLERLVDDLLLVAQLESGTFTLETSDVDLRKVVTECIEAAKPLALSKTIDLTLDAAEPVSYRGDTHRLEQLFENLISNALKYTPEGGHVSTKLSRENGDIQIVVQDSGIGIGSEDQQFLFDRFFRATTARTTTIPGVGLGLTIVKAITEAHSGRVEVESEEGQGTTFRIQLPLEQHSLAA